MKRWGLLFVVVVLGGCQGEVENSKTPDVIPVVSEPVKKQAVAKPAPDKNVKYSVDEKSGLIKAPGFETVSQQCVVCHSAKLVTQNRGDRAHWESMIRWMQKTQGLWELPPATEDEILTYLSTHYGPSEDGRRPALAAALMPPKVPRAKSDPQTQRGLAQIKIAGTSLVGALKAGLKEGAPKALNACTQMAGPLTQAANAKGVTLGRTSTKLRNPKNTAPEWVAPLSQTLSASDVPYLTTELADGRLGIVKAIRIKPMCLACHGEPGKAVQAELDQHYPQDLATGYKAGDFRGVFWAEVNAH